MFWQDRVITNRPTDSYEEFEGRKISRTSFGVGAIFLSGRQFRSRHLNADLYWGGGLHARKLIDKLLYAPEGNFVHDAWYFDSANWWPMLTLHFGLDFNIGTGKDIK